MSTDNFNFKLGKMRHNVERKRDYVERIIEELAVLEDEFRLMCPHKEFSTQEIMIQGSDFYHRNEPHTQYTCTVCGFQRVVKN